MKTYAIVFTPEAEEQLAELYRYIADHGSRDVGLSYTGAIIEYCEAMQTAPHRGTRRDDIRPGLRITHWRTRRTLVGSAAPFHRTSESAMMDP